jgi:hypothetical protein
MINNLCEFLDADELGVGPLIFPPIKKISIKVKVKG